ncbi:MAG: right-handed parallel beta-helix repeat-containing protein [Candidatus Aenigmarchaeota archaeon]|nr:right-handed parallel beta-helix repeat-containing protein [Candidatus Aenigmarchaeota archaeon]
MRIKQILIIIFALAITSFIGYKFGLSQSGNVLKSVVEPGSMVTEASYVIFTDGAMIYARDGNTGEIVNSNTDASTVINWAINQLTNGGKIFIKAGTYELSSYINVGTNTWDIPFTIEGEGFNTILKIADNTNTPIIRSRCAVTTGCVNGFVHLRNFQIDGNKDNNNFGSYCIEWAVYQGTIENIKIKNCKSHGIYLIGNGTGASASDNSIHNVIIANCDGDGIRAHGINGGNAADNRITDSTIFNNKGNGIYYDQGNPTIIGNAIYGNDKSGIVIYQLIWGQISENQIAGNGEHGIYFYNGFFLTQPTRQ